MAVKHRILFVCLGNICRSPAAEAVMKAIVHENHADKDFMIDSAGTARYHAGQQPDRRMYLHAIDRGIKLKHVCRQVRERDFENFDLIVAMDEANYDDLCELAPTAEAQKRVVRMGDFIPPEMHIDYVPDPYYEGSQGFELVLDLLDRACRNLYDYIIKT